VLKKYGTLNYVDTKIKYEKNVHFTRKPRQSNAENY
jgi:hypothetical protein